MAEKERAQTSSDVSTAIGVPVAELPVTSTRRVTAHLFKRSEDTLDYYVDLADWLEPAETITAATARVNLPGLEIALLQYASKGVVVWLADGEDERTFTVIVQVLTSRGKSKAITFDVETIGMPRIAAWLVGNGEPAPLAGTAGDMYLDGETSNIWQKKVNGWALVANIRGSDGENGADGRDGANGADGRDGVDGRDGADGADGRDGANGRDGLDGSGTLVVEASNSADVSLASGQVNLTYDSVDRDTAAAFDGDIFTPPSDGYYLFILTFYDTNTSTSYEKVLYARDVASDTNLPEWGNLGAYGSGNSLIGSLMIVPFLTAGQQVRTRMYNNTAQAFSVLKLKIIKIA